jgi:hypothetical protein
MGDLGLDLALERLVDLMVGLARPDGLAVVRVHDRALLVVDLHARETGVAERAGPQGTRDLVETARGQPTLELVRRDLPLDADPPEQRGVAPRVDQRAALDSLVQHGADRHAERGDDDQAEEAELAEQGEPEAHH